MAEQGAATGSVLDKVKVSSGIGLIIFVLTLGVWIFFRVMDMPLDPVGTTVVATALTILAVSGQWLWSHRRHRRAGAPAASTAGAVAVSTPDKGLK